MNAPSPVVVRSVKYFDPAKVFVHVSKEYDTDGSELGVFIHLGNWSKASDPPVETGSGTKNTYQKSQMFVGSRSSEWFMVYAPQLEQAFYTGPRDQAFYLAGRNSAPEAGQYTTPPANPFPGANTPKATRYQGNGALRVSFSERITTEPGKTKTSPPVIRDILREGSAHTLLPCDNELLPLGVSEEAYRNAANPAAVKAAIESGLGEIATLMRPVFYQDNRHTFFVEPSVTERTIEEWQEWVTRPPRAQTRLPSQSWLKIEVIAATKKPLPIPDDRQASRITPYAVINPAPVQDWLVNRMTVLAFDNVLLGPAGQSGLEVVTSVDQPAPGAHINVNP
ncbi:MAG: hypothetical protein NZM94_03450, partial [Roseiflexus sp.]|nr:hypothetical protein [Roseiflexus sp.]